MHHSNNSRDKYARCPRMWEHVYLDGRVPRAPRAALILGAAYADRLEHYRNAGALLPLAHDADMPTRQGHALAERYIAQAPLAGAECLATEVDWEMTLDGQRWIGRLDALYRIESRVWIVEDKSSGRWSSDTDYIRMISPQAMLYMLAAYERAIPGLTGIPEGVMYLTAIKPALKRRLATPPDKRYKKDGGLRANARERDETDGEYVARWAAASVVHRSPMRYTERQIQEYRRNVVQWGHMMTVARTRRRLPMALGPACQDYGRCDYLDVCAGLISIDDDMYFKDRERR